MNESLFQVLASEDAAEQERLSGNRAVIAVQTRVQEKFEKFVKKAKSEEDLEARIALISSEISKIVADAAIGYDYPNEDKLILAATAVLGGGHPSGCDCGFCKNKGKLPGTQDDDDGDDDDSDEKESSFKTAFDYPSVDGSLEGEQANDFGGPIGVQLEDATKGDNDETLGGPIGENASGKKGASVEQQLVAKTVAQQEAKEYTRQFLASKWQVVASFCDCSCEGCANGGTHCESEKCIETKRGEPEPMKNSRTSADVETGDTYAQERESLPAADDSGLGGPSPKIDKSRVPAEGLKAVDVPSEFHPVEQQSIGETTPDYGKDLPGPSNTGKSIDADSPLQPEHNVAPNTDTWSGTEGQATPVTSSIDKWRLVG